MLWYPPLRGILTCLLFLVYLVLPRLCRICDRLMISLEIVYRPHRIE